MHNLFLSILSVFFFAIALLPASAAGEDLVTPQDLGTGFRNNRSRFRAPRILISGILRWEEGWREYALKTADNSERLAQSTDLPQSKRNSLLKSAKLLRAGVKSSKPLYVFQDYRTDWTGFHGRVPALPPASVPETWTFPEAPITPDNLVSAYKDHVVFSFRPQLTPRTRVWNGLQGKAEKSGRVSDKPAKEIVSAFQFPPLGVRDVSWGHPGTWSLIDQFFEKHEKDATVVGQESLDGKQVYHVRHVTYTNAPDGIALSSGKFEIGAIVDGWIDPKQGFLPLKLEWRNGIYRDRKPVYLPNLPQKRLEVTEVREIPGGGFYPWKGIVRDYVDDPIRPEKEASIDDMINGAAPTQIRKLLNTVNEWTTLKVDPDAGVSKEMYALEFPQSTNYFDETKQRVMIQGLSEGEVDRLLGPGPENVADQKVQAGGFELRRRTIWLVLLNLGAIFVGIAVWYLYFRKR